MLTALLLAPTLDRTVKPQRSDGAAAPGPWRACRVSPVDSVSHVTLVAALASVLRGRAPVLARVSAFVQSAG